MSRSLRLIQATLLFHLLAVAQTTPDVGSGAIPEAARQDFLRAYFRNGFNSLTSLPPVNDVQSLSPSGYKQEFPDAAKTTGIRYALVRNTTTSTSPAIGSENTFQVYPDMWTYYQKVGATNAGYPTMDTQKCTVGTYSCTYQLFDKNYALFTFTVDQGNGTTFTTKDPIFSKWKTAGGAGTLGPAVNVEESPTTGAGTSATATQQRFAYGFVVNMTAGTYTGRVFAVTRPISTLYDANGGAAGFLGFPITDEFVTGTNTRRQNFEGGAIEYTVGSDPLLRLPVSSVSVSVVNIGVSTLNLGDSVGLTATAYAANGDVLSGRVINWISSNSRILTVDPSGVTVTAKAVGGGTATISAVSEGKTSRAISFFVTAPCCQIGEGAPSATVQQAFADAVTRNRIAVKIPTPSPVRRVGNGYVQEVAPADSTSTVRYLLAKPDTSANVFLITGAILLRYLDLGGPTGSLGYPLSDPSAGGRQVFEGGALAGNPPQLVTDPILSRWSAQNFENGPAGVPTGAASDLLSFNATVGQSQAFTNAGYFAHRSGTYSGRAFLVSGPILTKYATLGGAVGRLGLPTSDEFSVTGRRRQEFEGGAISYAAGDADATVEDRGRRPQITANPSTATPGSRLRIAAGGFDAGATLRITVGNQPDFIVTAKTGAYAWEVYVPQGASPGIVNLRAADTNATALAVGSYVVQSTSETLAKISKVRGDLQTGLPGARLSQPFVVSVTDDSGTPLPGLPVRFTPSPGAQIESASAVTDDKGLAQAYLRLPQTELPALATAEAGGQVTTFSSRSQAASLTNYPKFAAPQPQDALVTSASSILRYLQNAAQIPSPNGPADPAALKTFLANFCQFDPDGNKICDGSAGSNINIWRLGAFASGAVTPQPVALTSNGIRDTLGQGSPVLLILSVVNGSTPIGAHFVTAYGVASNGAILVQDPIASLQKASLDGYLNSPVTGTSLTMALTGALRLNPGSTSGLGFVVISTQPRAEISSVAGSCGYELSWPDSPFVPGRIPTATVPPIRSRFCDGAQQAYQIDITGSGAAPVLYSLGSVSSRADLNYPPPASLRAVRPDTVWVASQQTVTFDATGIFNAANFLPGIAPATLAAVFGQGLSAASGGSAVELDGNPTQLVAVTPFQINFAIPADAAPGPHSLRIRSPFGSAEQTINLASFAPAIFTAGGTRGMISNPDGSTNSPLLPAKRGQTAVIFATGLGAVTQQGDALVHQEPVSAAIEDFPLEIIAASPADGLPGVSQIFVRIPPATPPGIDQRLVIEQSGLRSTPVLISVE